VVMLWPKGGLQFNPAWAPAGGVRLGEVMANKA
jgi:phosphatidylserine decarboxylase